ncbi:MAG TPA: DUF5668 domain-containing protein [Candidatus Paceibacterota bacterium]|nr:DUF5668 domain-containing protein [Candidatus Paceibacterota bacterium]
MRTGIIVLSVGVIFLLKNLGLLDAVSFSLVWPTLLIVAGFALIALPTYRCGVCNKKNWKGNAVCRNCVKDVRSSGEEGTKIA